METHLFMLLLLLLHLLVLSSSQYPCQPPEYLYCSSLPNSPLPYSVVTHSPLPFFLRSASSLHSSLHCSGLMSIVIMLQLLLVIMFCLKTNYDY